MKTVREYGWIRNLVDRGGVWGVRWLRWMLVGVRYVVLWVLVEGLMLRLWKRFGVSIRNGGWWDRVGDGWLLGMVVWVVRCMWVGSSWWRMVLGMMGFKEVRIGYARYFGNDYLEGTVDGCRIREDHLNVVHVYIRELNKRFDLDSGGSAKLRDGVLKEMERRRNRVLRKVYRLCWLGVGLYGLARLSRRGYGNLGVMRFNVGFRGFNAAGELDNEGLAWDRRELWNLGGICQLSGCVGDRIWKSWCANVMGVIARDCGSSVLLGKKDLEVLQWGADDRGVWEQSRRRGVDVIKPNYGWDFGHRGRRRRMLALARAALTLEYALRISEYSNVLGLWVKEYNMQRQLMEIMDKRLKKRL